MSVIVDVSLFPMDKGEGLSPDSAGSMRLIEDSGLPYAFPSTPDPLNFRTPDP